MSDDKSSSKVKDVESPDESQCEDLPVIHHPLSPLKVDIASLPPMPTPNRDAQRQEMIGGTTLVILLILVFVGLTHGVALTAIGGFDKGDSGWWTFLILIYTEAVFALVSLVGLVVADPGVVQRSPVCCFPLPIQVEPWVKAHLELNDKDCVDILAPEDLYISSPDGSGDTYCVRCLLWRKNSKAGTKFFHCATCQRCVENFDHHCTVFGRCIAGTIVEGNYKYFWTIVASGFFAYFTTVVALIWNLAIRFEPKWVVPFSLLGLWFVNVSLCNPATNNLCLICRRGANQLCEMMRQCIKK